MSNTVNVTLPANVYTEISEGELEGYFTNASSVSLQFAEAATIPASTLVGHRLHPKSDGVTYKLDAGQKIWAKPEADSGASNVAVTPQVAS